MTAEILRVRASDGAETDATVFAATETHAPMLIIWPAMGTSARFYQPLAEALAACGFNAVTVDLRGIGSSSLRASRAVDFGYADMAEKDWPAAVAAVRSRFPDAPLYLLGHSLGGQLSALYAASQPQAVAGILLIACSSVYYRGWPAPKRWSLLFFTQFAAVLAMLFGYFPGKRLGFAGTEAKTMMRDWARLARSGRFQLQGTQTNYEAALGKLRKPVLGISFEHDDFAPHAAAQNLLDKMPAARHLKLSAQDSGARLNHFNWVKRPDLIVPRIKDWLRQPA